MKEFFKMFGAVMAGLFSWGCLTTIVWIAILSSLVGGLFNDSDIPLEIEHNSVLKLDLSKSISERSATRYSNLYSAMSASDVELLGLNDIENALESAAYDDDISALYISCTGYNLPDPATAEALRKMILRFKESGKPVVAFSNSYSNFDYYVATAADSVYMRKSGNFQLSGLGSQLMYYKGALDKFGISAQVIRHGKFKSAVEPFLQETMSEENRSQISAYLSDIWSEIASGISESRGIQLDKIESYANSLELFSDCGLCVSEGFLDGVLLESDVKNCISELVSADKPRYLSVKEYCSYLVNTSEAQSRIAVIYADGELSYEQTETSFSSTEIVESIKSALNDVDVKAVVLRVNSPGGAADEAEVIYSELLKLKDSKPLVVSMGGYAASGGYYISAPADMIFAENTTITGSIGVFGLMLSPDKLLKNTLGINLQSVKTHKHSGFMNFMGDIPSDEVDIMQRSVEQVYSTFVSHVAEGRGMTFDDVDAIAQGRVWTGKTALELGLVDEIGSLCDAIDCAAYLADVKSFQLKEYPDVKDGLSEIFSSLMEASAKAYYGDEIYQQRNFVRRIKSYVGVQALMPASRIY